MFGAIVFVLVTALPLIASRPALPEPYVAPSCAQVLVDLRPCLSFIKGKSEPTPACCNGVSGINSLARTKPDKVAICGCLKTILGSIGAYDPKLIPTLPKKCNVPVDLPPIDKNYDCNKVSMFTIYDDPMHEKEDVVIHKGVIKANYIYDDQDSIAPKGMISVRDDPTHEMQDSIAPKGMINGNYMGDDGMIFDVPVGF